jgi:hypothetical protein
MDMLFVLVSVEPVAMCPAVDNPASWDIHAVIHTKSTSSVEIHSELCAVVYSQNVVSEGTLKQWCRIFKDG